MKIRAKATGEEIDVSDAAAKELIDAGIYDPVDEAAEEAQRSTKVEPLSTKNTPPLGKKAK